MPPAGADVLATVLSHAGSTYAKGGLRAWIPADGSMSSMLNGGCFDADLLEQAALVRASGAPRVLVYDARDPVDELTGSGSGCRGAITVLLEPAGRLAAGFLRWLDTLGTERPGPALAVTRIHGRIAHGEVVDVERVRLASPAGTLLIDGVLHGSEIAALRALPVGGGVRLLALGAACSSLAEKVRVPLRLLVLGGGRDAEPIVALAGMLGWRTVVVDHRPLRADPVWFPAAESVRLVRIPAPATGRSTWPSDERGDAPAVATLRPLAGCFDAALVMTHNMALDEAALAWLAGGDVPFIGLLGPAGRRDRLLARLGPAAASMAGRLYAPVGLHLGGHGPAGIALSIVAQVQAHHAGVAGGPLPAQARSPLRRPVRTGAPASASGHE